MLEMDENSILYKIGAGIAGVFTLFIIKPFWQAMKGGWDANASNSAAQVQMISVLQGELEGYRKREEEGRELLKEVYQLRVELKEAREQLELQSKHIDEQSAMIEKLRNEIKELRNAKG